MKLLFLKAVREVIGKVLCRLYLSPLPKKWIDKLYDRTQWRLNLHIKRLETSNG